jgi:hypothetical protein
LARVLIRAATPWLAALLFCLAAVPARANTILTFEDVLAQMGSDTPFFTPIHSQGFTLTATNPPTGFSSGFEAFGPTSPSYAGEVGIITFAPAASPPDNVIELTRDDGQPFDLVSIDLARINAFDPAPTVAFTGIKAGGGIVMQSFTVMVPLGTAAFQTFDFTRFTGLTSVSWGQPQLSDGLHQFSRIDIATGAVPEPAGLLLLSLGLAPIGGVACLRRRASNVRSTTRP